MLYNARPRVLTGEQTVYSARDTVPLVGYHELQVALRRGWDLERAWPLPKNRFVRIQYYKKRITALHSLLFQMGKDHCLYERTNAWLQYTRWLMVWYTHDIGFPSQHGVGSLLHIVDPERTRLSQCVYANRNTLTALFRTPESLPHDHTLPYWLHAYNAWFSQHCSDIYFVVHALWCAEIIDAIRVYLEQSDVAHLRWSDMDIAKMWYRKWIHGREATDHKCNASWVTPETLHVQHQKEWKWIIRYYSPCVALLGEDAQDANSVAAWLCLRTYRLWQCYAPQDPRWMQQYDRLVHTGERLLAPFALFEMTGLH